MTCVTKNADRGRFCESKVRPWLGWLFRGLRNLHAAGGIKHRLDDVVVTGAAADIAFQFVPDGRLVELAAVAMDDVDRRHDHAGRAVAALQAMIVAKRGLHRMQFIAL